MSEAEPVSLKSLERARADAIARGDHVAAIQVAKQIEERVGPPHTEALYDLARLHALRGETVAAYSWLQRAVGAGFWDARRLREDGAFEPFRAEENFLELMRGAWANGYRLMLEHEERASFQKPDEVVAALGIAPGDRVAEIGSGSGYFTVRLARAVGGSGTVWAHDASQEMLDHLARRLRWEKLENVGLRKVGREDPELPEGSIDLVLLVDVLHYVQDLAAYAKVLGPALAPGGRIAVIDYRPKPWDERPWGPPPEQQIPRETIDQALATAGLFPRNVFEFLPEQYFAIYAAG